MLVDKCTILIKAGNGGNGIISWRKEAHYPEGGPFGGDGGNGGNVYVIGDHNLNSLVNLKFKKKIKAENGGNGGTKLCHGKNGNDVYINVPIGTVLIDTKTNKVIVDILKTGQQYLICKGGNGGKGNFYFKSSKNRVPNLCENGDLGEEKLINFELKYIADVGLVGLPNAGKSSFVNAVSNTNLKTANYPFTTLSPFLGVVKHQDEKLVFSDIPGIIKNASNGAGLGLNFLKHIERCHFLIHLISISTSDTFDPFSDFLTIQNELLKYNKKILKKRFYIVLNKIDDEHSQKNIDDFIKKINKHSPSTKVYLISVLNKTNLEELLNDIFENYKKNKNTWLNEIKKKVSSYSLVKVEKNKEDKIVYYLDDNNIWNVSSNKIKYWSNKIPFNTNDNIIRFMQKIKIDEIEIELKNKGAKSGDTFKVENHDFEIN